MRKCSIAIVIIATGLMAGCAAPQYQAELLRAQLNAPYLLASGDRLRVIVFGQENLSNSFSVDGAGDISMPLIGIVKASGLTTADLERVIEARLRNGFIREPRVSVEVEAYRPFFVLGEVTTATAAANATIVGRMIHHLRRTMARKSFGRSMAPSRD